MKKYDITINDISFQDNVIFIDWSAKGVGFGQLTISVSYDNENPPFLVETECMGENFYKQVMEAAKLYIFEKSKIIE